MEEEDDHNLLNKFFLRLKGGTQSGEDPEQAWVEQIPWIWKSHQLY